MGPKPELESTVYKQREQLNSGHTRQDYTVVYASSKGLEEIGE